ncbi:DUF5689 domain-containing protein [Maribacter litopenaei]|uniref:DUF5689 domain-containing protein n=1 Tax=Maribacter litopenaei TaxID=2976127 RepID=A0ABY5Y7E9_9FLAO|nr:DUF5689 domain-containing protein [Maribacter litopenaei]UWX54771.1 DUF5689 domain-containing protein [Maribacter litopenaei]
MVCMFFACVKNKDFEELEPACESNLVANISIQELKEYYQGETLQIQEDLILEGYVISSDTENNFFSVLYFQNTPSNPTDGLQIEIDMRDSHLFFEVGNKILIKLKGLYLGRSEISIKLVEYLPPLGMYPLGDCRTTKSLSMSL